MRLDRKKGIRFLFAVAVALVLFAVSRLTVNKTPPIIGRSDKIKGSAPMGHKDKNIRVRSEPSMEKDESFSDAPYSLPTVEEFRAEAAADPHGTPVSVLSFSAQMGDEMQMALSSEEASDRLLKKLSDCALRPTALVFQSICVTNAKVIAKAYPNLQSKVEELIRDVNPEVIRLIGSR